MKFEIDYKSFSENDSERNWNKINLLATGLVFQKKTNPIIRNRCSFRVLSKNGSELMSRIMRDNLIEFVNTTDCI